ncbi:MAG: hypothetical protein H7A25_16395 [Leptospiraceae bacterium]|nr:hypothetical protein [Leptospiraceae bacterium]
MRNIFKDLELKRNFEKWLLKMEKRDFSIDLEEARKRFKKFSLFNSFSRFITDFTAILRLIGRSSTSINQNMKEILQFSSSLKEEADSIHKITDDFKKSIENLHLEFQNLASEIGEIHYQTKNMVHNNTGIMQSSKEIHEKVKNGVEVMSNGVYLMGELTEQNRELQKTIKELWDNYGSISKVAEELVKLAQRTELIALNAEIESSHAGEEGSGFAIVAREMGNLSRRNMEVARIIAKSAKGMKEQAKLSELNVESSVEFALGAENEINIANKNYKEIDAAIGNVINDSSEFSISLKNLEISITMMNELVKDTKEMIQRFINRSKDVFSSLDSQEECIQNINSVVSSTFDVSRILNSLVSQFNIPNFKNSSQKQIFFETVLEKALNARGLVVMAVFSDDALFTKVSYNKLKELEMDMQNYLEVPENIDLIKKEQLDLEKFLQYWKAFLMHCEESLQLSLQGEKNKSRELYNQKARKKIKEILDILLASIS